MRIKFPISRIPAFAGMTLSCLLHTLFIGSFWWISRDVTSSVPTTITVVWMEKKAEPPPKLSKERKKPQKATARPQMALERAPLTPARPLAKTTAVSKPILRRAHCPLPAYPWASRKRGHEGVVAIFIRTNEAGQVIETKVEKSSGHERLDEAALTAVKSWILAENNVEKTISIAFRLKG